MQTGFMPVKCEQFFWYKEDGIRDLRAGDVVVPKDGSEDRGQIMTPILDPIELVEMFLNTCWEFSPAAYAAGLLNQAIQMRLS